MATPTVTGLRHNWPAFVVGGIAVLCMLAVTGHSDSQTTKLQDWALQQEKDRQTHEKEVERQKQAREAEIAEKLKWLVKFDDAVTDVITDPSRETIRKLKEIHDARPRERH